MFGDLLRKGLGMGQELDGESGLQQPNVQSGFGQFLNQSLFKPQAMRGFGQTPQGPDMYNQYNNPLMFLRKF